MFLTIWFKPSMAEIEYDGSYQLLKGMPVSEAFASTLHISLRRPRPPRPPDPPLGGPAVRGGGLRAHAARVLHRRVPQAARGQLADRRRPHVDVADRGFAGYSLPDDLLSGTGLRFVDGLIRSIPIIGTWAEFFVFAGEYPGDLVIPRLYMVHILLIPRPAAGPGVGAPC